ncbi:transposase [Pseudomaricurvus alkylphenolicus]|uniref:transposase n=1 Tax=Pseudomaricurvus alkylphenolicus TaxID=1306991 RepID=UPI00197F506D
MLEPELTHRGEGRQYERHRPESTLLYRLIEENYPTFLDHLASMGRTLPAYVRAEFEDYLECGRLEHGFLRVKCDSCRFERLVAFSCKKRGFCPSCGARRMADSAALLVDEILPKVPVRQWVLSVPIPLRLLLAHNSEAMSKVLQVVVRAISSFLIRRAGYRVREAHTGAVTLVQRFGSALNLNLHYHTLMLDGVYVQDARSGYLKFHPIKAPSERELTQLLQRISQRVAKALVRQGLLVVDEESTYLAGEDFFDENEETATLRHLQSHSVNYRIAVGPQAGRKALMLKTLPPLDEWDCLSQAAKVNGFSLHAGVAASAKQRDKIERLCRYITRPPVSEKRLTLTAQGQIRYHLKTPYKDGTTHIILDPLDFVARLAALVPKPRVNLIRYHGVLAPNAKHRGEIAPSGRGRGGKCGSRTNAANGSSHSGQDWLDKAPEERHRAMRWAQRLKRVFNIDIETCASCGGRVKVIACIEESLPRERSECIGYPVVIKKILDHEKAKHEREASDSPGLPRGPPQADLFQ